MGCLGSTSDTASSVCFLRKQLRIVAGIVWGATWLFLVSLHIVHSIDIVCVFVCMRMQMCIVLFMSNWFTYSGLFQSIYASMLWCNVWKYITFFFSYLFFFPHKLGFIRGAPSKCFLKKCFGALAKLFVFSFH